MHGAHNAAKLSIALLVRVDFRQCRHEHARYTTLLLHSTHAVLNPCGHNCRGRHGIVVMEHGPNQSGSHAAAHTHVYHTGHRHHTRAVHAHWAARSHCHPSHVHSHTHVHSHIHTHSHTHALGRTGRHAARAAHGVAGHRRRLRT